MRQKYYGEESVTSLPSVCIRFYTNKSANLDGFFFMTDRTKTLLIIRLILYILFLVYLLYTIIFCTKQNFECVIVLIKKYFSLDKKFMISEKNLIYIFLYICFEFRLLMTILFIRSVILTVFLGMLVLHKNLRSFKRWVYVELQSLWIV